MYIKEDNFIDIVNSIKANKHKIELIDKEECYTNQFYKKRHFSSHYIFETIIFFTIVNEVGKTFLEQLFVGNTYKTSK